jgi:hypothetical protein
VGTPNLFFKVGIVSWATIGSQLRFTKRGCNDSREQVWDRQSHALKSAHIIMIIGSRMLMLCLLKPSEVATLRRRELEQRRARLDKKLVLQAFIIKQKIIEDGVAQTTRTVGLSRSDIVKVLDDITGSSLRELCGGQCRCAAPESHGRGNRWSYIVVTHSVSVELENRRLLGAHMSTNANVIP